MPKIRSGNTIRSQGENAPAPPPPTSTRNTRAGSARISTRRRNENENGNDSEKENVGRRASRTTGPQTRARGPALGVIATTNTPLVTATTSGKGKLGEKAVKKTAAKGQGKPTAAPIEQKKLPLQDITAEFLPAFAATNRGQDVEGPANEPSPGAESANPVAAANLPSELRSPLPQPPVKFTSPLPPSSPPSESDPISSPFRKPRSAVPALYDSFALPSTHSIPQEPYDPWQEFDDARAASQASSGNASSASDPFGFVSLERKLKSEREHERERQATAAAARSGPDPELGQDDLEDLDNLLVADTSSPRPVGLRRLKRTNDDAELADDNAEDAALPNVSHFQTPPTPHKDKQKRRRLSHEGHDIFSPCSSSIGSSPSPVKKSASKTPYTRKDPLDEFNEALEHRDLEVHNSLKKKKPTEVVDPDAVSMNLRTRTKRQTEDNDNAGVASDDDAADAKRRTASNSRARGTKKAASKPKNEKPAANEDDEEDLDEKWERERQDRLEYFKRLEGYQVEKEDVYII
ncbi:hypothetical protein D9613_001080 [Agrocybe pediades]|uniref:Uncharacterized protein n=1 Tax=Agrocybe pediades TaxID=84607 RepID=A0A8H4VS17_9AGAR|nr:hypothetical protein D9613_001080 [Agrocybe pediades]